MDRELVVKKDGYVLGQILFKYQTQTSGSAGILINKIEDIEHGLKAVYPLYKYEEVFSHIELLSKRLIKTFFTKSPIRRSNLAEISNLLTRLSITAIAV
jgi:hypothetical protein